MSYQVLARKWRPKNFSELVGQEHVVRALSNGLDGGRLHHAFLFTGTRGVGKTTIARIFAKSLNCERGQSSQPCGECRACLDIDAGRFVDLLEIDAASHTGVDDVRDMIENAQYTPARGRQKVYLIDEVHMLSKNAFNALLKTLEEPPPHVKFLLATTDPQKLPVTVLSRCLKFNLKRLLPEQIGGQMRHILDAEGIRYDAPAITMLARGADGSLRDGLSLLDQAIAYGGGAVQADEVRSMLGTIERAQVGRLLDAVIAGDGSALLREVGKLAEFSPDFGLVLDDLAGLLHRVQLKQLVPGYIAEDLGDDADCVRYAAAIGAEDVQLYYQLVVSGRRDLSLAPTPRTGFDMALLRLLAFRPLEGGGAIASAPGTTTSAAPAATPVTRAAEPSAIQTERRPTVAPPPAPSREPAPQPRAELPDVASPVVATGPLQVDDWAALIEQAGLRGPVGQLARQAALLGVEGHTLRLALRAEHEHLNAPSFVTSLEQYLATALGRPQVRVRFEKASAAIDTPADAAARSRSSQQQEAERALDADPVVQALARELGGRIVPNSVRPPEG